MAETKIKAGMISLGQKMGLLGPYVKKRLMAQINAVALIVIYLIFFQIFILGIPISQAIFVAIGISVVVGGLMFFMEGLFLGLMPLGETIGISLPKKAKLPLILLFAAILGFGVTLAEPAIGVLKAAGSSVKAWDAPLLFLLLNKNSSLLVYAVGSGVGLAVLFGMLRFVYNWSLKPYLYILIPSLLTFTLFCTFHPNLKYLVGLAWDCGGVTTGPVTVPLVLALGIGICRVVSKSAGEAAGFGVVTLASLFPILTVLTLGVFFAGDVPAPAEEGLFFKPETRAATASLFVDETEMKGYVLRNGKPSTQLTLFNGNNDSLLAFVNALSSDPALRNKVFGTTDVEALHIWAVSKGTESQRLAVFGTPEAVRTAVCKYAALPPAAFDLVDVMKRNSMAAIQAILPLALFLLIVLFILLRERLSRPDEVVLGILFGLVGLSLFNVGIELGLARLGNGVGSALPALFKKIEVAEDRKVISNFDESVIQSSISPAGEKELFFNAKMDDKYVQIPFNRDSYDSLNKNYIYAPTRGPLYGSKNIVLGIAVVLLFAFIMGYGATLAEPALNALGLTVEELTVGTFKKVLLMQAVAAGVGLGMVFGLIKIIFNVPLVWFLAPPYLLLMFLSKISSEEYVNIGWDSAGVTTGPITVPLVLAMGLGVSGQVNVVEGFGILAMASVMPILTVLGMGLFVNWRRRALESGKS